jgi:hypothetical protein
MILTDGLIQRLGEFVVQHIVQLIEGFQAGKQRDERLPLLLYIMFDGIIQE